MNRSDVLSLEKVLDEPLAFDFELSIPAAGLDREPLVEVSPVRFEGEVARIEGGYSLQGMLSYSGRLECSRCLVPYPFREAERFDLVLYRRAPAGTEDKELDKADLDACFYDEPDVPVAPIVEERMQLAVPMKPLCSPDCRGLCVRCGADLNRGACGCPAETIDPRWEALKALAQGPEGKVPPLR